MSLSLTDLLRDAYQGRNVAARIDDSGGVLAVEGDGYVMRLTTDSGRLVASVDGEISREAYYALGLTDEQTEGAISRALNRAGRKRDAEQVARSLDAIQAGRGLIYRGAY